MGFIGGTFFSEEILVKIAGKKFSTIERAIKKALENQEPFH